MPVFLAYHSPCLDGVYSLFTSFIFFREIQKAGIPTSEFMKYISQFEDYASINQTIFQYKQPIKQNSDSGLEEHKVDPTKVHSNEYSLTNVQDIICTPIKLDSHGAFTFPYHKYGKAFLKSSILILMDHSGCNAFTILDMCLRFKKVIIIDHHVSFEHNLDDLKNKKGYPKNLLHFYRKENSGAILSLEFFEKIKGAPLFDNEKQQKKLLEILRYVEDNDIRANKEPKGPYFISGLLSKRLIQDPNSNTSLFKMLFDINVENTIKIGIKEQEFRKAQSKHLIKEKTLIYLGGRTAEGTGRYGICYGVECYDLSLRSLVAEDLANESLKDGLHNMGVFYRKDQNSKLWNLSLRSLQGFPGGDCESLARLYAGGGHYHAAGLSLSHKQMKSWL